MPRSNRVRTDVILLGLCAGLVAWGAAAAEKSSEGDVGLKHGTWEDVQKIVEGNPGKVIVVDAWSTSCIPCMREFPNLVKLHERFPKEVVCVSFSCDYVGIKSKPPKFYEERVLKFLTKQKATFTNLLSTTDADAVYEEMGVNSIPAVFVYGGDGKLAKKFDSESGEGGEEEPFTYEDVTALVEKLVGDK